MSKDIVERLGQFYDEIVADDGGESPQMAMTREALDEIKRLRKALEIRNAEVVDALKWLGTRLAPPAG